MTSSHATCRRFSVALNIFWRSHDDEVHAAALYDKKDLYGNREPPAAARALEHAARQRAKFKPSAPTPGARTLGAPAVAELARLPEPFRSFYTARAERILIGDAAPVVVL